MESETEMEEHTTLIKKTAFQRFRSFMSIDVAQFKWMANMVILCFSIGEIVAFLLLQQSVNNLELPSNLPDIVLISVAAAEFLLAPFLGWLGTSRRRTVILASLLMGIAVTMPLLVVPSSELSNELGDSELCIPLLQYIPPLMMSTRATLRLCVALLAGITYSFARIVVWSHTIAYLAECEPDQMNMSFGVILVGRVLGLVSACGMKENVEKSPFMIVIMFMTFLVPNALKIFLNPLHTPDTKEQPMLHGLGYLTTLKRVYLNKNLMMNAVSIALMSAALWNFAYYEKDVVKTMYQISPSDSMLYSIVTTLYYHVWILPIVLVGYLYSKPVLAEYCEAKALMMSNKLTVGALIVFVLMVFVKDISGCQFGNVGERVGPYRTFNQPICSGLCLCSSPLNVYSPVCVPDDMTTYYSPCHAGCKNITNFNGIEVLGGCSCGGGSGRAVRGACSDAVCSGAHRLHQLLFLLLLGFGLIAIQQQGSSFVRSCDARDRSAAVGVLLSLVALVAFIIVHATFMQLRIKTCAWNQNGICQLQTPTFVYSVAFTSVGLTAGSLLISIVNFICVKRRKETIV